MTYVVINEQHSLFTQQEAMLMENFDEVDFISVPASGWKLEEMKGFEKKYQLEAGDTIVFASPIPFLVSHLSKQLHYWDSPDMSVPGVELKYRVLVFHNDNRNKVELPGGKIINKISAEGWVLA